MTETIAEIKTRLYPQRKAAVLKHVECYRDRLLSIADGADEENEEMINIPLGMAYALVDVCNFVERLDSYGIDQCQGELLKINEIIMAVGEVKVAEQSTTVKAVAKYILATNDVIRDLEREVKLLGESKVAKLLDDQIKKADYWRDKYLELSGCGEVSPTELAP